MQNDKATWWQTKTQEIDSAKDSKSVWQNFHKIGSKRAQAETNNPVTKKDGNPTENDLEKNNEVAETLGEIHNTHKGPILTITSKKEWTAKLQEITIFSTH